MTEKTIAADVLVRCARCGQDHNSVVFMPLKRPVEYEGKVVWTHWAPCPVTGEPILVRTVYGTREEVVP